MADDKWVLGPSVPVTRTAGGANVPEGLPGRQVDYPDYGVAQPLSERQREQLRQGDLPPCPVSREPHHVRFVDLHSLPRGPLPPTASQFERLLWLLGLSEQERAFVTAAAENPADEPMLLVFADWLEERGRGVEAARLREAGQ